MIGRIHRVGLREVWAHEAFDFTTWLQDNIDILAEATGLQLSGVEREQPAGAFSVDLIAEDVEAVATRTNADGVATIPLRSSGRWYVRTIHMVETTNEPDLDCESNWDTLTFEMR